MSQKTQKGTITHTQLTPYEEACIVILALLGIYTFFSWSGLIGSVLSPSTNPAVLFLYAIIEWGIPIILGVFGLTLAIIGLAKLKKKDATGMLSGFVYVVTIVFSAFTLLGSAGYLLLIFL